MSAHGRKTADVYLGLGSNLGDPLAALRRAVSELYGRELLLAPIRRSSIYRTPPWGDVPDQPCFLNAVVGGKTALSPQKLLAKLQDLERDLGRTRGDVRWGPRTIDLDILLFGRESLNLPDLIVPHPRLIERAFALAPLVEIAPDLTDIATGRSYGSYLERLADQIATIEKLDEIL